MLLPDWRGRLALVHVQKTGGTTLQVACHDACLQSLNCTHDLRKSRAIRFIDFTCGCGFIVGRAHWSPVELQVAWAAAWPRLEHGPLHVLTLLREPVSRVVSEFDFLRTDEGRTAILQDQWDYTQPNGSLTPLGARLLDQKLGLAEFIELEPGTNPALNRQTRYIAGHVHKHWHGRGGCCLDIFAHSLAHWLGRHWGAANAPSRTDLAEATNREQRVLSALRQLAKNTSSSAAAAGARTPAGSFSLPPLTHAHLDAALSALRGMLLVGVLEKLDDVAELLQYQIGWDSGWTRRHNRKAQPHSPGKQEARRNASLRARIRELNALDERLYQEAAHMLSTRIAAVRATRRTQDPEQRTD